METFSSGGADLSNLEPANQTVTSAVLYAYEWTADAAEVEYRDDFYRAAQADNHWDKASEDVDTGENWRLIVVDTDQTRHETQTQVDDWLTGFRDRVVQCSDLDQDFRAT